MRPLPLPSTGAANVVVDHKVGFFLGRITIVAMPSIRHKLADRGSAVFAGSNQGVSCALLGVLLYLFGIGNEARTLAFHTVAVI